MTQTSCMDFEQSDDYAYAYENPIDLLPITRPLEDDNPPSPKEFYAKVVQPLIPDIIYLMDKGIPINLDNVKKLEDTVSNILEKTYDILANNPRMQEFEEHRYKKKFSKKTKNYTEFLKPFNEKNSLHRAYALKTAFNVTDMQAEITAKSLKKFKDLNITDAQKQLAMEQLAKDKARIFNEKLEHTMQKKNTLKFNPSSPKQKAELFAFFNIQSDQKTAKGQEQWDRSELEKALKIVEDKDIQQIIQCLIDISYAGIIKNNFINAFYDYSFNGRLYGTYKLFGAKSFRLTSSNPNMLNLPSTGSIYAKDIKRCFVAEKDKIFYQIDFSALEDRVIANLSRDANKCSIFTKGLDGHCLNSYYYFKDEIEAILPRKEEETDEEYIKRYKQLVDDGNKQLKAIRQKSKGCTFGLSYGAYPQKVAESIKCTIEEATSIFNNYHNKLYPDISKMREQVLEYAKKHKFIHLGLGCIIKTSNPEKEIRTIFNACSQFWSILSLLTINKLNSLIIENGFQDNIEVVSTIYDSIYIHVDNIPEKIKWLNDTIVPIMTTDFLKDTIVHNVAEGEIGYNFADTVKIPNNADISTIINALNELKENDNGI